MNVTTGCLEGWRRELVAGGASIPGVVGFITIFSGFHPVAIGATLGGIGLFLAFALVIMYLTGALWPANGSHEQPDRDDVVDIEVPTELLGGDPTDDACVSVPLESVCLRSVPSSIVFLVDTSLPVRMAVSLVGSREPVGSAIVRAEYTIALDVRWIPLEGSSTIMTREFPISTIPSWVILTRLRLRNCSPIRVLTHSAQYNPGFSEG